MSKNLSSRAENRRNGAEYIGAGAALVGASAAADGLVGLDRKRRGMSGPVRALRNKTFVRRHVGQVAAKVGGRAAFAAGAPLAAYGGYKMLKPDEGRTPRFNVKRDVAKPFVAGVKLKDLADLQEARVNKADLTDQEQSKLVDRKKKGRGIALTSAALGVAALGLRTPEGLKAAVRIPKVGQKFGNLRPVKSMVAGEEAATKASNTVGVGALGLGAAGSLNYAAQQKLEAKAIKKSMFTHAYVKGMGKVRVLGQHSKDTFMVLSSKDHKHLVPRGRLVPLSDKKKAGKPAQMELEFGKANRDRFLRNYGDRISPEAEKGYQHLRSGRNEARGQLALSAAGVGLAGYAGAQTPSMFRAAKRTKNVKGAVITGAIGTAAAGIGAFNVAGGYQAGMKSHRWNQKMAKIKAKGRERAASNEFGRGRVVKSIGRKAEGSAQVAAGGTVLGLGLSANRLMNNAENRFDAKINAGAAQRIANLGDVKALKEKAAKKLHSGRVTEIGNTRNALLNKNPYRRISGAKGGGRIALVAAGLTAGVPNIWMGSRKVVEKADKNDVDAFMAGGLATVGAYYGGMYSTGGVERKLARQVKTGADFQATERAHRKVNGLEGPARKGDARWKAYHRTYPTMTALPKGAQGPVRPMPGAQWRRRSSRLFAGKTQIAVSGALAAGGGLAAAKINRKIDPVSGRNVSKALVPRMRLARGVLRPKAPGYKPRIKQSYVGTSVSGRKFNVRGSVR